MSKAPVFAVPGGSGKPTEQTWSEFIVGATNLQNANGWTTANLALEAVKAQDAKDRSAFRATSLMFDKPMAPTTTQALAKAVEARPNKAFLQARAWGAAAALNEEGSAWPHRKAIIEAQLYANGGCGLRSGLASAAASAGWWWARPQASPGPCFCPPAGPGLALTWLSPTAPSAGDDGASWLSTTRTSAAPATSGLYYFNYLDADLTFDQYFGANADRLFEAKQAYDVGNYIQGWQGMPKYEGKRGAAADIAPDASAGKAGTGKRNGTAVVGQPPARSSDSSSYAASNSSSPAGPTIKVNGTSSDSRGASPAGNSCAAVGATALTALLVVLQLALA
jgi:hypothetical protein